VIFFYYYDIITLSASVPSWAFPSLLDNPPLIIPTSVKLSFFLVAN